MNSDSCVPERFIIAGKHVIQIRLIAGFWCDSFGTVFALRDTTASVDPEVRCGVGWLSVSFLADACRPHDFIYECPTYQVFHNRSEADDYLRRLVELDGEGSVLGLLGKPFKWLAHTFGGRFWENNDTRDK